MNTRKRLAARALRPELLFALVAAVGAGSAAVHWGYHGEEGPENWGPLDPSFVLCAEGHTQSPIDLVTSDFESSDGHAHDFSPLDFHYADKTSLEVVNNGHTIQANVPPGAGRLSLSGVAYELLQFHFHTPSEHLVNGHEFPVELHLVHMAADGTLAVVGVFIEPGSVHEQLDTFWSNLPGDAGHPTAAGEFDLNSLLPKDRASARYDGSLTTPPCSEGVKWNVLARGITLSESQIDAFRSLFHGGDFPDGNRRPVQPLQGRAVVSDFQEN